MWWTKGLRIMWPLNNWGNKVCTSHNWVLMYQQSQLEDWGNDPRERPKAGTKNTLTLIRHSSSYLRSLLEESACMYAQQQTTTPSLLYFWSSIVAPLRLKQLSPPSAHTHTHWHTHTKNTHGLTLTPLSLSLSLPAKWATLLLRISLTRVWSVSLGHHIFLHSRTFCVAWSVTALLTGYNVCLFNRHKVNSDM